MPRDKVDVARRAVDAYNCGDVDGFFAELATPDYEFSLAPQDPRWGGIPFGREGIERLAADRVLVLGRLMGRGKGSGAPFDQPYAGIFDFRGGRIWRYCRYLDRAERLRAARVGTRRLSRPCQPWAWSTILIDFPELRIPRA